ncbi:MAG: hypothetical protein Q8R37_03780, partial [Nanoarchaeota archaeon]|nr:hypothetical protein [Nanoarchaeota archaeon]
MPQETKPHSRRKQKRSFAVRDSDAHDSEKRALEAREGWKPVTALGRMVKEGKITDINDIFDQGYTILEPEIVTILLPHLDEDLLLIGQAKGKFGGGQRRIFRQTQKKTREGNRIHFMTCVV